MELFNCPSCGERTIRAKYCVYCGAKLNYQMPVVESEKSRGGEDTYPIQFDSFFHLCDLLFSGEITLEVFSSTFDESFVAFRRARAKRLAAVEDRLRKLEKLVESEEKLEVRKKLGIISDKEYVMEVVPIAREIKSLKAELKPYVESMKELYDDEMLRKLGEYVERLEQFDVSGEDTFSRKWFESVKKHFRNLYETLKKERDLLVRAGLLS